ncbi:MAG: hypothetical protein IPM54_22935 [Polyangiaceae bacterium]|nr:hypothetical protein [Polyangiaceae bacterium]
MAILATRTLNYVDDHGVMKDVTMTLLKRIEQDGTWKLGLRFGAPITWEMFIRGDDVLETITSILAAWWVRLFVGGMPIANNIRWIDGQGKESFNCGLPALRKRPDTWTAEAIPPTEKNPGNLEILSESTAPFPDRTGVEQERPVFVFMPQQMTDGRWRCGFAFDAKDTAPIRYGVGDDWIQAFLDAAAMIRVVYESMLPQGWKPRDGIGLEMLPYKMGRGYFIDERE